MGDCSKVKSGCNATQVLMIPPSGVHTCMQECPPGYTAIKGKDSKNPICTECMGRIPRDGVKRSNRCEPCSMGTISKKGSDSCQPLPESCDLNDASMVAQCRTCLKCMLGVSG